MSTRAGLLYTEKSDWYIYIELLDDTVHIEINKPGASVDITLMSFDDWVALGLPKQNPAPNIASTRLAPQDGVSEGVTEGASR